MVVADLLTGAFHQIEPHLRDLDEHLTLRTYLDGYTLSELDRYTWLPLRANRAAVAFIKKGSLPNLQRWFACERQTRRCPQGWSKEADTRGDLDIEAVHPEIQDTIKAQHAADKAKTAAASRKGASYNIALQHVDKGVVTRFLPEPS